MTTGPSREVRLGDLVSASRGVSYKGVDVDVEVAESELLSITAIVPGGGLDVAGLRSYAGPFGEAHCCAPGDIVIALTDLTQTGKMLGSPARSPARRGSVIAAHHVARVHSIAPEVDPSWLYWRLHGLDWLQWAASTATGTTIRQIAAQTLHDWRVILPALQEQGRVARALDVFDRAIEVSRTACLAVDRVVRNVGQKAEREACDASPLRVPLGELVELAGSPVQPGRSPEQVFSHFSIPAFDQGGGPTHDRGVAIRSGKLSLGGPVVLVSKLNPHRWWRVWDVDPAREAHPAVCSTEFVPLRAVAVPHSVLVGLLRWSPDLRGQALACATGTTTSRQRFRPDDLLRCTVSARAVRGLDDLDSRLAPLVSLERDLHAQQIALERTRDLILPALLQGVL